MTSKLKTYWTLFISSLYISAVTFGSGYVMVSVIKKRYVDDLKWIDCDEMADLIALGQSSPGAIAVNTAQLVGYKIRGVPGALLAIVGVALPPLFTIFIISLFYDALRGNAMVSAVLKGMQAGVCAVIADVVVSLFIGVIKDKSISKIAKIAIMACAFAAAFVFDVNLILIVLFFIALGVASHFLGRRRRKAG